MAYTVNILRSAKADIEDKIKYLIAEWGAAQARQAYNKHMDKLDLLASQPTMASTVPELLDLGRPDYTILVHETHTKILYRIDEDKQAIEIHMVYGSRQNFQDLLYKRVIRFSE